MNGYYTYAEACIAARRRRKIIGNSLLLAYLLAVGTLVVLLCYGVL
jgi:hypothetical protein